MFLYGKNSIFERLKNNPRSIEKVFFQDNFDSPQIEKLVKSSRIACEHLSLNRLQRIKRADNLGGIVAKVSKFEYADLADLFPAAENNQLSLIFLDRIFDPQNLGAIMRSAACLEKFAVIVPKHRACEVTDTVLHIAQGAENYIPVAMVINITNTILQAKKSGIWIAGAVTSEAEDLTKAKLPFPLALVLGSEGKGIRYGVDKHLDLRLNIPMSGAALSFNVAAACSIFCYEINRQRPNR